jgi:hypothetical protein
MKGGERPPTKSLTPLAVSGRPTAKADVAAEGASLDHDRTIARQRSATDVRRAAVWAAYADETRGEQT